MWALNLPYTKAAPPRKQQKFHHKPCSKDVAQPLPTLTFHHAYTKTQTRSPQSVLNTRPNSSLFNETSWKTKPYIKIEFRTSSKTWQKCVELEHPARLTQFCVMNYSFIHSMKHYMTSRKFAMKIRTCLYNTNSTQSLNNFVIVASNVLLYLQHNRGQKTQNATPDLDGSDERRRSATSTREPRRFDNRDFAYLWKLSYCFSRHTNRKHNRKMALA